MAKPDLLLEFDGIFRPLRVADAATLVPVFAKVFQSWPFWESHSRNAPLIEIRQDESSYLLSSPWLRNPVRHRDPVNLTCALVAEIFRAHVQDHPEMLCLHGAAASFAGRLVVFPSSYRAGKSLLSACLAQNGIELYSDDVLPVAARGGPGAEEGVAPGIAPRLRLPYPGNLSASALEFLSRHRGPGSKRYQYLDLPQSRLARRGARLPIGGFVLLERQAGAKPELLPLEESDLLRQVIWRNFAREEAAAIALERLHALVAGSERYRLRYDRAEEAAALLQDHFSAWRPQEEAVAAPANRSPPCIQDNSEPLPPGCYRQRRGITERVADGSHFLSEPEGAAIHQLDPLASALWRLLDSPTTEDELVTLLDTAFPEVASDQIRGDIRNLLADLTAKGLLQRASA